MAGHSKWSQIKRQKGVADAKRGQVFTKLAKIVSVAARKGGGDPAMNPALRVAMEQARAENMPKENIERAIKRGTGALGGAAIEELRFEAYGPGGVGILIDAATDNHLRTNAEMKAVLNRLGGKLATTGAVAFQFVERGLLTLPMTGQALPREGIELAIITADALNYEDQGDAFQVMTEPKELSRVKEALESQNITVGESKLSWEPTQTLAITDPVVAKQVLHLLSALEDLDDITAVTANFVIPDELLSSS
jgi:YebC/PmpR family DNA-binding regulatory protein